MPNFNIRPILQQPDMGDANVPYSDSGDTQAFPSAPVEQYSMPRTGGLSETVYSKQPEIDAISKQSPTMLVPPDSDTTLSRVILDGRKGLNPSNATPTAIQQYGNSWKGDYGTDYSMTYDAGPYVAIIPTIWNGILHSPKEAINRYHATQTQKKPLGEHFGVFDGPTERLTNYAASDKHASLIHQRPQYRADGSLYQGPGLPSRKISDVRKKNVD